MAQGHNLWQPGALTQESSRQLEEFTVCSIVVLETEPLPVLNLCGRKGTELPVNKQTWRSFLWDWPNPTSCFLFFTSLTLLSSHNAPRPYPAVLELQFIIQLRFPEERYAVVR